MTQAEAERLAREEKSVARMPKITGSVNTGFRASKANPQDVKRRETLQQQTRQQADGYYRSTGWNAVEASRRVQQLKDKRTGETEVEVSRQIEGRSFRSVDGAWIDQTAPAKPKVVAVKYGSEAYFKLVTTRAEWARFLSAGRQVTFRTGKTTVVAVGETGKEKLTDAELKALEK